MHKANLIFLLEWCDMVDFPYQCELTQGLQWESPNGNSNESYATKKEAGRPPECSFFIDLWNWNIASYHKCSSSYKDTKFDYIPWSKLVSFESISFHYIVTFPQAPFFVQACIFSNDCWNVILLMVNFIESYLYLLFLNNNSFSGACPIWSDVS